MGSLSRQLKEQEQQELDVGKKEFLLSLNVISGHAHANQAVPTPSVYADDRGEIHNVRVGGKRVNLLYSRKGVMRSGDVHTNTQHDFLFSGKAQVWCLAQNGQTIRKIYGPYEYVAIPPYVPHVFEFLEDTVMAEWWDEPFRAWYYIPYRNVVESSFHCNLGRLRKLVFEPKVGQTCSLVMGVAAGLLVGLSLSGRFRK
mmetsp:Transcript_13846/g.19835  ORF Transcript_13846/g.19835 Transcript_13846/m.19835 type:complete len:199 (+) Transcript_13846:98-694(+)